MNTLSKLAPRLNWRSTAKALTRVKQARVKQDQTNPLPRFFVFTDDQRLPDPVSILPRLPRGAAIVLRHRDADQLRHLVARITPLAHRLGIKVLVANDARLAIRHRCDGVHLSQAQTRRGPLRIASLAPDFMITAAAHDGPSMRRAKFAHAHLVFLSPVFNTASHLNAKTLGIRRFARLARLSDVPVVALGGVTATTAKCLTLGPAYGLGAIEAWRS